MSVRGQFARHARAGLQNMMATPNSGRGESQKPGSIIFAEPTAGNRLSWSSRGRTCIRLTRSRGYTWSAATSTVCADGQGICFRTMPLPPLLLLLLRLLCACMRERGSRSLPPPPSFPTAPAPAAAIVAVETTPVSHGEAPPGWRCSTRCLPRSVSKNPTTRESWAASHESEVATTCPGCTSRISASCQSGGGTLVAPPPTLPCGTNPPSAAASQLEGGELLGGGGGTNSAWSSGNASSSSLSSI
mmetsp:Transcript_21014/g.52249  ORF Transcript_21014/g.52249 Transcript_21014/m.52249 type:complete len:245 (-) Transcript_21014:436-1170(-)